MSIKETCLLFTCLILILCKEEENSSKRDGDVTRFNQAPHGDVASRKIRFSGRNGGDGKSDDSNAYRELLERQNDMIMEDLKEALQVTERSTDFDDEQIDKILLKAVKERAKNASTSEEAALNNLLANIIRKEAVKHKRSASFKSPSSTTFQGKDDDPTMSDDE